jgi:hypothetical protein
LQVLNVRIVAETLLTRTVLDFVFLVKMWEVRDHLSRCLVFTSSGLRNFEIVELATLWKICRLGTPKEARVGEQPHGE